ncbi:hypothetical protein MMC11_001557 [Xylographa trunciseda]|nr:hypothetical protein [Xylographa trunciseda]
MAFDEASHQLQKELHNSVKRAMEAHRPILTHLNADTSWLLQLPYPEGSGPPSGRLFYNILIDPWLSGLQSDFASWFSTQWHAIPSSFKTIAELDERLSEAGKLDSVESPSDAEDKPEKPRPLSIDLVVVSHEFTDHMHQPTLLEIDPSVPVFATQKAAASIRSWNHFTSISVIDHFSEKDLDWRHTSVNPLPDWIGISRLVTNWDAMYLHSALLFTFNLGVGHKIHGADDEEAAEAIIYTPHGILADDLRLLSQAAPSIRTLALLHDYNEVDLSILTRLNLGIHNGLKAQRACKAKYYIGTHDEAKEGRGILMPFLRRKVLSVQDALEKEQGEDADTTGYPADAVDAKFLMLASGENLLLE